MEGRLHRENNDGVPRPQQCSRADSRLLRGFQLAYDWLSKWIVPDWVSARHTVVVVVVVVVVVAWHVVEYMERDVENTLHTHAHAHRHTQQREGGGGVTCQRAYTDSVSGSVEVVR